MLQNSTFPDSTISEFENKSSGFPILHLPNEIVFEIFSYLDVETLLVKVRQVCQVWKEIVNSDSLWKSFHTLSLIVSQKPSNVKKLIGHCPNLRHLHIIAKERHKFKLNCTLFSAAFHLKNLRSFTLNQFILNSICADAFRVFLNHSHDLKSLDLSGCQITYEVGEALTSAANLRNLNLALCFTIDEHSIVKILKKSKELEKLNLSGQYINSSCVTSLLRYRSSSLKELVLKDIPLSDNAFIFINKCFQLSVLKLYGRNLSDITLERIKHLPLKDLEIPFGRDFTSEGLHNFFINACVSDLNFLNVSHCPQLDNATLQIITARCSKLNRLSVDHCSKVTFEGIEYILKGCLHLRSLSLIGVDCGEGSFLRCIPEHAKYLKALSLFRCKALLSSNVKQFLARNPNFIIKSSFQVEQEINNNPEIVMNPYFQPVLLISSDIIREVNIKS